MGDRRPFFLRLLSSVGLASGRPSSKQPAALPPTTTATSTPTTEITPPTTTSSPTTVITPPTTTSTPTTASAPPSTTTSTPTTEPTPPTTTSTPTAASTPPTSTTTSGPTTEPAPLATTISAPTTLPTTTTTTSEPTTAPPSAANASAPSAPTTVTIPNTNAESAPTTTPIVELQSISQSTASTTNPSTKTPESTIENQTTGSPSTPSSPPNPTTPPSRGTTQSQSSSHNTSPSRQGAQSRSPPQPLSPTRSSPTQSTPSSPFRMAPQTPSPPQRAKQPHSPSHSPKQTSPNLPKGDYPTSPLKDSRESIQEISNSFEAPTSTSQQEPQHIAEVKSTSANDHNGETKSVASTMNGRHEPLNESNDKPAETKDVKEVVQATNKEANEETKKGISPTPLPSEKPNNNTISQPRKRNATSNAHNKSSLPIRGHMPLHKDIRDDISTFLNRMAIGDPKSDKPVSVITLVGENRGASMQMGSNSSKTDGQIHIHRSYKINADESTEAATDGEGSSKEKKSGDAKSAEDQPTEAYINNNAQGINNSIVFNGSITEGNPGVHMAVTHVPNVPTEPKDKAGQVEPRKAEFNTTRAEKHTYEPRVRRRCLRGLFLETSDSDEENPEKPRSHGCRVGCQPAKE